jgi:uncharacterized membrane protein YfcA
MRMGSDPRLLLLAAIVVFAFTTEATIGFGSSVISLALGVRLYPIHELLPMIVPLNLLLTSYVALRHHDHIAAALVVRRILPWMGIGVALGFAVFQYASGDALKRLFGAFVLVVALREAASVLRPDGRPALAMATRGQAAGLLAAGITHGMFACGGPLLVYVLGHAGLDKRSFRSTLASVWWVFNVVLIAGLVLSKRLDATTLPKLGVLIPSVLVSIAAGEWIHRRLNEQRFRLAVSVLLVIAGLSIVL